MDNIVDFLNSSELDKLELFNKLNCEKEHAKILQYLLKEYVNGNDSTTVLQTLTSIYTQDDYTFITKIDLIKRLIDLGWLELNFIGEVPIKESKIDILNSNITLSSDFINLIEKKDIKRIKLSSSRYRDNLEYLEDEFKKIVIYYKLSILKFIYQFENSELSHSLNLLKEIEQNIVKRLKISKNNLTILKYLNRESLNKKEKIIFLSLIKEEIGDSSYGLRNYNTLLNLISKNSKDRLRNRGYLSEDSKLIEKGLINFDEIVTPFGSIEKSFFIPNEILDSILNKSLLKKSIRGSQKLKTAVEKQSIFELLSSETSMDDVVLNSSTREMLDVLIKQLNPKSIKLLKDWGIKKSSTKLDAKIIFYGSAGTGKTLTATSLAKSMNKDILSLDCSKILSMYVGESEKNVRNIFDTYKTLSKNSNSEPILLLNEADQFLSSRTSSALSSTDKMHNQMQNIFLEQIERFDGVLIATTNLLDSIDKAFSRRFNYKIEFKRPTKEQRRAIWIKKLPKRAKYSIDFNVDSLIDYDLSGGQIDLVIKNCAYKVVIKSEPIFTIDDFLLEIKRELSSKFDSSKVLGFIS